MWIEYEERDMSSVNRIWDLFARDRCCVVDSCWLENRVCWPECILYLETRRSKQQKVRSLRIRAAANEYSH